MSDKQKKRYYWLKLKENFFEEDTIEWLEEQPNGKEYCLFYLKLCLKSLKTEGLLVRNVGNMMIPYDPESLAKITNSKADTVKVAMDLFKKIGLIQILDSGEIYLNQLNELVGTETEYARQKRLQRSKEDNVQTLSGKGRLEIELEKEIDIELEKEIDNIPPSKKSQAKPVRHKYGEYKNVLLTDQDLEKLKTEFPSDWQERIERLSAYMASTGKTYKNHLATIRNWARKDKAQPKPQQNYGQPVKRETLPDWEAQKANFKSDPERKAYIDQMMNEYFKEE